MKFYIYSETIPESIPVPTISGLKLPITPVEVPQKPLTTAEVDARIRPGNRVYDFPPVIKKFIEPALPRIREHFLKNYYNSRMLRLEKYDGNYHTGITYYFEHRLIHHEADAQIYRGQTIRDALEDLLIEEIEQKNPESIFPNGLGVNALLITADNYIIIPRRSKNVSISRNKYAPTISFGAVHRNHPNIMEWNIKNALLREYSYIPSPATKTLYLGLYRNLYTMGSPEMYFIMKVTEGIDKFEAKINEENRKIEALEAGDITSTAESIAYDLDPDSTSEHLFALLYLINHHKKELGKHL